MEMQIVDEDKQLEKINQDQVSINPEILILRAIDKNVDVTVMEKLLAMRQVLKVEAARDDYFSALARFQSECPAIQKTKGVYNSAAKGGGLRYFYAPLDAIISQVKELLEKHGFSYLIKTENQIDKVTIISAECIVHHVGGHEESTKFSVPIDPDAYMNAQQKFASALTFAKRYAFCNAFGIMTADADDDSNCNLPDEKPQRPAAKPQTGKPDIATAPEEVRKLMQSIFHAVREKYKGRELFPLQKEKEGYVKSANTLFSENNVAGIQKLLESLVLLTADRKRQIDNQ